MADTKEEWEDLDRQEDDEETPAAAASVPSPPAKRKPGGRKGSKRRERPRSELYRICRIFHEGTWKSQRAFLRSDDSGDLTESDQQVFCRAYKKYKEGTLEDTDAKRVRGPAPNTMRAAVYRSFEGPIRVENVPRPTCPDDGVVLQVKATGVCRSDWHGWKGHDGDIVEHGFPFVPGHECSGVIVKIGKDVTSLEVGDPVAVPFILSCGTCRECGRDKPTVCEKQEQPGFTRWGSFAEYVALPRADRNMSRIPEGVSFVEAAALGCRFTTAYRAVVQRGQIKRDQTVAIFGAGGLGLSCTMIASSQGAGKIISVDKSREALKKAKEVGATDVVDASYGDDYVRMRVSELTDGMGADLTIDAAGFPATCENAVWCTRRAGRMVQVGLPIGGRNPLIPMGLVCGREIDICGSHGLAAMDMPEVLSLVVEGRLDPKKLVEREVTLSEGATAIEEMNKGSPLGIIMVTKFDRQITPLEDGPRSSKHVLDSEATV